VVRGRVELPTFRFSAGFSVAETIPRRRVKAQLTSVTAGQWTNAAMLPLFRPGPPTSVLSVGFLCQHTHSQPLCGHSVGQQAAAAFPRYAIVTRHQDSHAGEQGAGRSALQLAWPVADMESQSPRPADVMAAASNACRQRWSGAKDAPQSPRWPDLYVKDVR
jgi:hypothetical protein